MEQLNIKKLMKQPTKVVIPDTFVDKDDRQLLFVSVAIAIAFIICFTVPFTLEANTILRTAVPTVMAAVMLITPIFMYLGVILDEKSKLNELLIEERKIIAERARAKKILFTATYRLTESGTQWIVHNNSKGSWSNAKLLVERTYQDHVSTEKHDLGFVPMRGKVTIDSELTCPIGTSWRVMLLAKEGYHLDVPERTRDLYFQTWEKNNP